MSLPGIHMLMSFNHCSAIIRDGVEFTQNSSPRSIFTPLNAFVFPI